MVACNQKQQAAGYYYCFGCFGKGFINLEDGLAAFTFYMQAVRHNFYNCCIGKAANHV